MRKLGVGVIGCGGVSSARLSAYGELADECELITVCDQRRIIQAAEPWLECPFLSERPGL